MGKVSLLFLSPTNPDPSPGQHVPTCNPLFLYIHRVLDRRSFALDPDKTREGRTRMWYGFDRNWCTIVYPSCRFSVCVQLQSNFLLIWNVDVELHLRFFIAEFNRFDYFLKFLILKGKIKGTKEFDCSIRCKKKNL